jgi:aminopeptidase 2
MCKLHAGAEVAGSGLGISKGREILPANVKPTNYDLTLEPDFENFTYDGSVKIE